MRKYSLFIAFFSGLASCGIYRQNVVNAPLMQEKGQTQLSGHISFSGLEAQAAYAATKSFVLLANYNNMGARTDGDFATDKHIFKEIGAGLYTKNKKGKTEEIFLIVGNGMTSHALLKPDATGRYQFQKVNYNRVVLQGDYGSRKRALEYALSPRLLGIHYNKIIDNTRTDYKTLGNFHIYFEAGATLRYNFLEHFKLSAQGCATIPFGRSGVGYNYYYDFSPFNFSIGLIYEMNVLRPFK